MSDAPATGAPAAMPGAQEPRERPALDEVMLAMDVVDTLRHRQELVDRELNRPEDDEALIGRLRRIYAAQGIEVTDRILREGVEALRENRFAYTPLENPPLWARLWVDRVTWFRRLAAVAAVAVLAVAAWWSLVVLPGQRLAADLDSRYQAIGAVATDPGVSQRAGDVYERSASALASGDRGQARAGLTELEELLVSLERSYRLVLPSGPDAAIGVWRIPDANPTARNYYLIVEAVDDQGQPVPLPIRNEETGRTETVAQFGLGVTRAAWDGVAADLEDDGLLQSDVVGVKERGELDPEYELEITGGAITRW